MSEPTNTLGYDLDENILMRVTLKAVLAGVDPDRFDPLLNGIIPILEDTENVFSGETIKSSDFLDWVRGKAETVTENKAEQEFLVDIGKAFIIHEVRSGNAVKSEEE